MWSALGTNKGRTRRVTNPKKEGPDIPGLLPGTMPRMNDEASVSFSCRATLSWPVFSQPFLARCPIFSSPISWKSSCSSQPMLSSPVPSYRPRFLRWKHCRRICPILKRNRMNRRSHVLARWERAWALRTRLLCHPPRQSRLFRLRRLPPRPRLLPLPEAPVHCLLRNCLCRNPSHPPESEYGIGPVQSWSAAPCLASCWKDNLSVSRCYRTRDALSSTLRFRNKIDTKKYGCVPICPCGNMAAGRIPAACYRGINER
jgi:hypothetical protein